MASLPVPDVLALRHLARTRLSVECRNQARQPRQGSCRNRDGTLPPERWPLNLLHHEEIPLEIETAVGSAKPLEHTARSASPALVQQLSVVVGSWPCARYGLLGTRYSRRLCNDLPGRRFRAAPWPGCLHWLLDAAVTLYLQATFTSFCSRLRQQLRFLRLSEQG